MKTRKRRRGLSGMQVFTSCISTSLVLILLGLVVFLVQLGKNLSESVREDLTVTVLLAEDAANQEIQLFRHQLEKERFAHHVNYISKEQALQEHIREMGTDPEDFLGGNPFSASLELHVNAVYANSDSLRWITRDMKADPLVADVIYQKDLIDSLNQNLTRVSIFLLVFAALLTFVSFGLINGMVKMSLYANRFLIHTMKLVGAKWSFIRKPFLKRSFWIGFSSALVADSFLISGIWIALRYDPILRQVINVQMIGVMAVSVLLVGIMFTWICSYMTLNKFLRMRASEMHEM